MHKLSDIYSLKDSSRTITTVSVFKGASVRIIRDIIRRDLFKECNLLCT